MNSKMLAKSLVAAMAFVAVLAQVSAAQACDENKKASHKAKKANAEKSVAGTTQIPLYQQEGKAKPQIPLYAPAVASQDNTAAKEAMEIKK